jgi:signal transduction histidine kinase
VPSAEALLATSPLAAALAAASLWRGRRHRLRLWRAVHELRRPIQGLALAIEQGRSEAAEACLGQARRALADLEDELDRAPRGSLPCPVALAALLADAERRWCGRVDAVPAPAGAAVQADRVALERALDNLIANAVEHGSPPVRLRVLVERPWALIEVTDAGPAPATAPGGGSRRGHGLRIAAAIAAEVGGELLPLRIEASGTSAGLRLPLAEGR